MLPSHLLKPKARKEEGGVSGTLVNPSPPYFTLCCLSRDSEPASRVPGGWVPRVLSPPPPPKGGLCAFLPLCLPGLCCCNSALRGAWPFFHWAPPSGPPASILVLGRRKVVRYGNVTSQGGAWEGSKREWSPRVHGCIGSWCFLPRCPGWGQMGLNWVFWPPEEEGHMSLGSGGACRYVCNVR